MLSSFITPTPMWIMRILFNHDIYPKISHDHGLVLSRQTTGESIWKINLLITQFYKSTLKNQVYIFFYVTAIRNTTS